MASGDVLPMDTAPAGSLTLRLSRSLAKAPVERPPPAPPAPPAVATPTQVVAPSTPPTPAPPAPAPRPAAQPVPAPTPALDTLREVSTAAGVLPVTVTLGALAAVACFGWISERRRNLHQQDSQFWAQEQPVLSVIDTRTIEERSHLLDAILPDNPDPDESARAIYVTGVGETTSRREATLFDLHQLQKKFARRRMRGDKVSAVLALQKHLEDFRYTSPWVFLELRELYIELDRHNEWELARDAFRRRFGQNAPAWTAPSTASSELLSDEQLCKGLVKHWPRRRARAWIMRWMLGEPDLRLRGMGPPLLTLGVYRDFLLLDELLDDVMEAPPAAERTNSPGALASADEHTDTPS